MGAVLDVEVAESDAEEAEVWLRSWADSPTLQGAGRDSAALAVDCAVCGTSHSPGTDDDPGCGD